MYILQGTNIKRPSSIEASNSTQMAQQRTLSGAVNRDYFGANKKVWVLEYQNCNKTDFDVIDTIYQAYLSTKTARTWEITETNYDVNQTNVHVDLVIRSFRVKGSDYISDFTLTLVEA